MACHGETLTIGLGLGLGGVFFTLPSWSSVLQGAIPMPSGPGNRGQMDPPTAGVAAACRGRSKWEEEEVEGRHLVSG